jgi:hypothetical protein
MIAKDVKQVCQKMGRSVVLIGGSAAPDDLLKLCGSGRSRKIKERRRRVVMKQRPKQGGGADGRKF